MTSGLQAVRSRIEVLIELPAPSLADVKLFAREQCEIEVAADLASDIFQRLGKSISIRSIVTELRRIEDAARLENLSSVNLATWRRLMGISEAAKIPATRLKALAVSEPREVRGGAA